MNCLYRTTTKNTFEEYKRFSRILFMTKRNIIIFSLLGAFLIFDGILVKNSFFIALAFIYPVIMFLIHNQQVEKVFSSNKVLQNADVNYEFYDTYFTSYFEFGNNKAEYGKLHKIIETKTNFYLMVSKNQGCILTKSTFPTGLEDFLKTIKI